MPPPSWDHFRTFEAIARLGTLTAAARALGVSQSTVSRHLRQLEEHAGSPLLVRASPAQLTVRGEALCRAIQPMVDGALGGHAALEASPELRGEVTVTTVGEIVRWVLVPALPKLLAMHPHLRLRLLAANEVTSLSAGDADIALRMFRPERGDLVGRRLRTEPYGLYAAPGLVLDERTPWIGLTGSLAQIPEQRYAERSFVDRRPHLLVEDIESQGQLVAAGVGVAVLAQRLAEHLQLTAITPADVGAQDAGEAPTKELWLVMHRTRQHLPKVRAVAQWLISCFSTNPP